MKLTATLARHRLAAAVAVVFLILLAVGGGFVGASRTEPTYQSEGIILVIPPGAGNPQATMNPFINLDQNMSQLAQALSTRMSSPDLVQQIHQRNPAVTGYTVAVRYDNSVVSAQPTSQVQFTVEATDAQLARDTVQQLMALSSDQLRQIQVHAGVTQGTLTDVVVLVPATSPTLLPATSARAAGLWAIGGLLIGLTILAVVVGLWTLYSTGYKGGPDKLSPVGADAVDVDAADTGADESGDARVGDTVAESDYSTPEYSQSTFRVGREQASANAERH